VSSSPQPVADLLADLARGLGALGVRWFLFGAQAAILHGSARLSADVDVTVDLGARTSRELVDALSHEGFGLRVTDAAGFVEATRVMPLVHLASRMPLDLVLAGPGLEEQFFARATERLVGDVSVPVVSAEDLVAMKILAGRPRDMEDVAGIVRARRDLDVESIRTTLRLLDRALDRADLVVELDRILASAKAGPG
jgi:nucleotidyltransferase AbiEii toxin of type IV toxin-antitoxin system